MARVPVWLLDVDGTVNARVADRAVWPSWHRLEVDFRGVFAFPVNVADGVLDYLRAVHEAGAAEIRWCSTWEDSARLDLAPALGLPDWPVERLERNGPRWAKIAVAERALATGRPVIWTDDDLSREQRRSGALRELSRHSALVWVSPDPDVGLTRSDLHRIDSALGVVSEAGS